MVKNNITVVMAGLENKEEMPKAVAETVLERTDFNLSIYSLGLSGFFITVVNRLDHLGFPFCAEYRPIEVGEEDVYIFLPAYHKSALKAALKQDKDLIVVNLTGLEFIEYFVELYCELGIPFVMGTAGVDSKKLAKTVKGSSTGAVIAPITDNVDCKDSDVQELLDAVKFLAKKSRLRRRGKVFTMTDVRKG